jgi:hypothetical protein
MSNPPTPTGMGTPFAPHLLVPVRVRPTTISLYPVVNPLMQPHEHAHTFHINKTALSAQNIDLRLQLDALGTQLNLSTTVHGTINNWFCFFYNSWFNFSKLTILSFHNIKGYILNNTTKAANPAILLPVQDGNLVDCHKKDVKFTRIQLTIDYSTFLNVNSTGPTILRAEYYIELPQTSRQLLNSQHTAYNLLTFHGPSNIHTLSPNQVQAQLLNITFQDGPVNLQPARFNLSLARTDSNEMRSDIEARILRLAFSTVCNTLFLKLCPGYSSQPHAAIDHIHQSPTDRNGNQVISLVQAYFKQLMGAAHPFSSHREFPVSVCACFQDGLDPRLQIGFHCYFLQHSVVQLLNTTHQQKTLQAMLQAAQQAEDYLHAIQRDMREAVGLSQAFHASGTGVVQPTAPAFPSQDEITLVQYLSDKGLLAASSPGSRGDRGTQRTWTCFGFIGPHPYSEYHPNDGHVVIFPNHDNPGVQENATKNIE